VPSGKRAPSFLSLLKSTVSVQATSATKDSSCLGRDLIAMAPRNVTIEACGAR
jgi:hypothetical protein